MKWALDFTSLDRDSMYSYTFVDVSSRELSACSASFFLPVADENDDCNEYEEKKSSSAGTHADY